MRFAKWHGLGNDFVLVNKDEENGRDFIGMAKLVCDRHFGIGADGLVTVAKLGEARFEMRIYNSDGTETEMCGNATRCVARYIARYGLSAARSLELDTRSGIIRPYLCDDGLVRVDMGAPRIGAANVEVGGFTGSDISMGNPHFVTFVADIAAVRLAEWGRALELNPYFPHKSNIEFAQVLAPDRIRMRVWERGCGVTLACGTGSSATCVAGVLTGRTARQVWIDLDGGSLQIEWSEKDNHVYMTGPAVEVFTGNYEVQA